MNNNGKSRYYLDFLCDEYDNKNKEVIQKKENKNSTEELIEKILDKNFNKKERMLCDENEYSLLKL